MSLYEVIGRNEPQYLLASPWGADVIAVPVEPMQGKITRGTVLYRKENNLYAKATTSEVTSEKYLVILDETVDTDAGNIAEDARAYRTGTFISGRVHLAEGEPVTAAHQVVLRQQGIFFDQMADGKAPEIPNFKVKITYKANGGTGADEIEIFEYNTSHQVKANDFVHPSGDTFQNWNTRPDGTGKTYAASSSHTFKEANVVLYAIWQSA